jgi:hypothetical protein
MNAFPKLDAHDLGKITFFPNVFLPDHESESSGVSNYRLGARLFQIYTALTSCLYPGFRFWRFDDVQELSLYVGSRSLRCAARGAGCSAGELEFFGNAARSSGRRFLPAASRS